MSKGAAVRRAEWRLKKAEAARAQAEYVYHETVSDASSDELGTVADDPEVKADLAARNKAIENAEKCADALQRRRWALGVRR